MDNLRLVLIIAGVALVAGIYLWETKIRRPRSADDEDDSLDPRYLDGFGTARNRRDLDYSRRLDARDAGMTRHGATDDIGETFDDEDAAVRPRPGLFPNSQPRDLDEEDRETMGSGRSERRRGASEIPAASAAHTVDEAELRGLDFIVPSASGREEPRSGGRGIASMFARERDSAARCDDESALVLGLTIMASRGQRFDGPALRGVLESMGFRHGAMNIFHLEAVTRSGPRMSVANVLKPGTFELERLAEFSTPGLALFTHVVGGDDGLAQLERMLAVGRELAHRLGGELRDESRSTLTQQAINHLREAIIEKARQGRLRR